MSYPRSSPDLSDYPDLTVIYLGFRISSLKSLLKLPRIGQGLRAVQANPPPGLLAHENMMFSPLHFGFRQYWRDWECLEAFTRDRTHMGWWRDFARTGGGAGIWHETYRMRGGMEAIYSGMPPTGLGRFAPPCDPVGPLRHARQRIEAAMTP